MSASLFAHGDFFMRDKEKANSNSREFLRPSVGWLVSLSFVLSSRVFLSPENVIIMGH